jgi:radical SAM-linked protein
MTRKYRLTFKKMGDARHLSHLELARVFIRAFKREDLPLVYSAGYHPMPRVSFLAALPVGTESWQETVDIEVTSALRFPLVAKLNQQLPAGLEVTALDDVTDVKKGLRPKESHFLVTLNGVKLSQEDLDHFHKLRDFPIVKRSKKGEREVNAKRLVRSMTLEASNAVSIALSQGEGPGLKPEEIVRRVFSLGEAACKGVRVLKLKDVFE